MTYIGKRAFLSVGRRGTQIGMPGFAGARFDFGQGVLPANVTFTRASSAWGFNSAGVLTAYATDAPRFVYDPITGANLGLLIEGARTNSIRNSTAVGAVAGTPGTVPTRWSASSTANAVTRTIVGTGTEDGIEYIDIQYAGTPSASSSMTITPEASTQTAAADTQVWAASYYVRLVAGSLTNVVVNGFLSGRDAGSSGIDSLNSGTVTPTSAPLRTQRVAWVNTLAGGTITGVDFDVRVNYTIALPIDITLRIGLPQLEVAEISSGTVSSLTGATSPIKTSTVAVARTADVVRITDPRVFTDKAYVISARVASGVPTTSGNQPLLQIDDGSNANRKYMNRDPAGFTIGTSPTTVAMAMGALTNNADIKVATRIDTDNSAASLNGGAVVTDIAGTMPAGLTTARIGNMATAYYWSSTIRSIETRATASDAELVALSTLPAPTDAELWITAVVTNGGSITPARKAIVEQFIAAEKAAGTWDLTDDYWPLWGENAPQALTSLKQRRLATANGGFTFTIDRDYLFNNTDAYINTGFIPNTHKVALTITSARIALYIRNNVLTTRYAAGTITDSINGLTLRPRITGEVVVGQPNANEPQWTLPLADSRGYTAISRNGTLTTDTAAYKQGAALTRTATSSSVSSSLTVNALLIGALNNGGTPSNFDNHAIGFAAVGASLTPTQEAAQYANVQAWATAIGAQV